MSRHIPLSTAALLTEEPAGLHFTLASHRPCEKGKSNLHLLANKKTETVS